MESNLKLLLIDASTGFYRTKRYKIGDYFGPVDLGLRLAGLHNSLTIGTGLLAGSIFPGSNRLFFTGFSPCWGGYFVSSMGGAGLVFDNLGINMLTILGKAPTPSVLYLNRSHNEEIEVEIAPVDVHEVWKQDEGGVYNMMEHVYKLYGHRYEEDPRILATGPSAESTDFGAIGSAPIKKGIITPVDTWAGRGGFGSKLLKEHGIAAIIYGGTFLDQDFTDRKVADAWFENKFQKKLAAKDLEATTKYRYDEKFQTGGTFGVNYATLQGNIVAFNYKTIYMTEEERLYIHKNFVVNHYLKQFNEETIQTKQQKHCGEPCGAVCKKLNNKYKKDYEPYQTMGPLCGIFDQRAAEMVNRRADMYGFDAISIGGVLSWLMECLEKGYLKPHEVEVNQKPVFTHEGFHVVKDSMHNAEIACALLDAIVNKNTLIDLSEGARKFAQSLARDRGRKVLDIFVYNAFARKGWMVPNQYWTPGVLSPMPIMGKYYMNYGKDFISPRKLGKANAERMIQEMMIDNMGFCRFHRGWAEDMIPELVGKLFGLKYEFIERTKQYASRINSRNSGIFWESRRNADFIYTFLKKKKEVEGKSNADLNFWLEAFEKNKQQAAFDFWYEIHKGIQETLREF